MQFNNWFIKPIDLNCIWFILYKIRHCLIIDSKIFMFVYVKIVIWINNNFILSDDLVSEGSVHVAFIAVRTNKPLLIKMESTGQCTFFTDDMELAGLLVQSLTLFLNIVDLQVTCDYPQELDNLQQVLLKVCLLFKSAFSDTFNSLIDTLLKD